jgi:serine/threonine-protein kinase
MSNFEDQFRTALSPAYDIERELTGAGMSRVFVATDRALGRKVVIKVLPPELTAGVNRERFRREIQVAAQLQHPHIVTLLSAGEDGEILYYTMPYIEGESLRHSLEKGPLSVKDVVRILHDVVDALAYAHARGVIHRDIKPGNILRQGSHALVTDFGVAKALNAATISGITSAGMAIGTPSYMAPEQLAGDPAADHRIDIYAVGLLAYELLTGDSPFTGPSPAATMAAQLTRDPEPLYQCCPDVPPPLSAIIMQCLAKEPSQRPPTAEALMTALDSITTSSGEIKTAATQVLPSVAKRKRQLTIAAAVATVALGSAVVVFASQRVERRQLAAAADTSATVPPPKAVTPIPGPVAEAKKAAAPIALTAADSLAIAEAVQKRLAREEALHGREHVTIVADSIAAIARKITIDSIVRANFPRARAGQMFDFGPEFAEMAAGFGGKRRVVVTEPKSSRNPSLNSFGSALADSLRRSLMSQKKFTVVDPDSVEAALAVSRVRSDVEKSLKPDVLISPSLVGGGDTMTVLVTVRDLRSGLANGARVVTARFAVNDPESAIPGLVKGVQSQIENLLRMPTVVRMKPRPPAPSARDR